MSLNFWNEKTTNVIPISSAFSFSFSSSYSLWYLLSLRRGIFSLAMVILKYYCGIICDALHDLVPFVQFKKCEEHPTLLKSDTPPWAFFTFCNCTNGFKLRKASHFMSESFCNFVSCHLQDANSKELILTTAKNFPNCTCSRILASNYFGLLSFSTLQEPFAQNTKNYEVTKTSLHP